MAISSPNSFFGVSPSHPLSPGQSWAARDPPTPFLGVPQHPLGAPQHLHGQETRSHLTLSVLFALPGVLFLQFGDETRRVHITHEISSMDTLHALIVHMFPQKLTMGMLKSPNTAILIKDESRNVFYELEDVR